MLAKGTDYFQGGLAIVGEQGPELVNMPRGSQVIPNNKLQGINGMTVNIITPKGTASEINREFTRMQRQMALGF